jgi:hypothetical protein
LYFLYGRDTIALTPYIHFKFAYKSIIVYFQGRDTIALTPLLISLKFSNTMNCRKRDTIALTFPHYYSQNMYFLYGRDTIALTPYIHFKFAYKSSILFSGA